MFQNFEKLVAVGSSGMTIIAPKFCCWGSAIAAMSSGASYLAWVYPLRPYLWGLSFMMIGISIYQAYKPAKKNCMSCADVKLSFVRSKTFTWIVAVLIVFIFVLSLTL